jgi:hypothetical protein
VTNWLLHSWSTFGVRTNHGQLRLIRLTTARTWGKPPPSPLLYTLCLFMRATSKWFFVRKLPSGSPEIPTARTPVTLGRITSCANLRLQWSLKQSCNPHQDIFNGMLHITRTWRNWVNSQLLVVGSQTANLTPSLSFAHNLCFRCPNGWCEPILDIYVSIAFQWYKELFEPMGFDP